MITAATEKRNPAEIKGVSESKPNLIANQVEPQIRHIRI
jgi:hypothetical protein